MVQADIRLGTRESERGRERVKREAKDSSDALNPLPPGGLTAPHHTDLSSQHPRVCAEASVIDVILLLCPCILNIITLFKRLKTC